MNRAAWLLTVDNDRTAHCNTGVYSPMDYYDTRRAWQCQNSTSIQKTASPPCSRGTLQAQHYFVGDAASSGAVTHTPASFSEKRNLSCSLQCTTTERLRGIIDANTLEDSAHIGPSRLAILSASRDHKLVFTVRQFSFADGFGDRSDRCEDALPGEHKPTLSNNCN